MILIANSIEFDNEMDKDELNKINDSLNNNPFFKCLVFKENNETYGYLCFEDIIDRIEIDYLFVKKSKRNMGIGTKLIQKIIEYSINNNYKNISLEVKKNNKAAIYLYEKFNFKKVAIRKNYYGNIDAVLMVREV
ncbi:MAG: GNAT family N-acetyltransferase [bacterium]|nr:GNAT family N-acetyltransferase [bacterium]